MKSVMFLFAFVVGSVATHLLWILAPLRAIEDSYQAGYYWGAVAGTIAGLWLAIIAGAAAWWFTSRRDDLVD